jgi:hypothetical protein
VIGFCTNEALVTGQHWPKGSDWSRRSSEVSSYLTTSYLLPHFLGNLAANVSSGKSDELATKAMAW